jgi:hypothetical protein
MKKLGLLSLLIFFVVGVIAQTPVQISKKLQIEGLEDGSDIRVPEAYNKLHFNRANETFTLNFPLLLDDFTGAGNWSPSLALVFPDSFVTIRWIDTDDTTQFDPQPVGWHSLGSSFDPYSEVMQDAGLDYKESWQPYTLDTVSFFYFYYRYTESQIVDTLLVQAYQSDALHKFTYSADQKPAFAIAELQRSPLKGKNAIYEEKIPLTAADTHTLETGAWGIMDVPLTNFQVPTGGPVGFTVTFLPGKTPSANDTIPVAKATEFPVESPQNAFRMGLYADPDPSYQVKEYNNGMLLNKQHRYANAVGFDNFKDQYFPGELWTNTLYPVIFFTITFDVDYGINEIGNSFSFTDIYPNPVNAMANMEFTLKNEEFVSIELYNSLGQKVNTLANEKYQPGNHKLSFETYGMQSGLYFAKVVVGESAKTTRFFVQ